MTIATLQLYYALLVDQRLEMKHKLVRLRLPPKLLAHVELLELRQHLDVEVCKLQYDFALDDADTVLSKDSPRVFRVNVDRATEDLIYLLNSPLFLYAIDLRVRFANSRLHNPTYEGSEPESTVIEARHLSIAVGHDGGGCFTQLRCGASALIDARELIRSAATESERRIQYRRCVQWFCDEVEFFSCEYRARDEGTEAMLGYGLMKDVRSKVVTLKVGKKRPAALEAKKCGRVQKERWMKLKLRLWKVAAEG